MKKSFPPLIRQLELLGVQVLLGCCMHPTMVHAERQVHIPGYYGKASDILPNISPTTLPTQATTVSGISGIDTTGSTMTVRQDKPKAIIHWGSFDVGSEASVRFDQPTSGAKVLNRVTGDSPSQIYGNLSANGQVYIINQNGILFGPGSKINVHSLTASALNIKFDKDLAEYTSLAKYDKQFLDHPSFWDGGAEKYQFDSRISHSEDAAVSNHGTIVGGDLGSIFLIGPQVENNGTITTLGGDVGLLAGETIGIKQFDHGEFDYTSITSSETVSGTATNLIDGKILTDKGSTSMYGMVVNQEGLIRATTALEKNGSIKLVGTNKVRTGESSITETPVVTNGERKITDPLKFTTGKITLSATEGVVEHHGHINNPSGTVTITAKDRVYLESGSSIDVSGSWVELTAADRTVEVTFNSEELRDAFAYKNGPLKGETVLVDIVNGLKFSDISGYLESIPQSAAMLTTKGGLITLEAQGDNGEVIVKDGAVLDFSGGGLIYADGYMALSKVRIGNRVFNLQDAPSGVPIDEFLGTFEQIHERYGLTDTWIGYYYGGSSSFFSYLSDFTQGADAGTLTFKGRKVVLDGTMNATAVRGIYQTLLAEDEDENHNLKTLGRKIPTAGILVIGETGGQKQELSDRSVDAVVIRDNVVPTSITADEALADEGSDIRISELSAALINNAGIGTLRLYPNQYATIEEDAHLSLAELGLVDIVSQQIAVEGSVRIPSGEVTLAMKSIATANEKPVTDISDRIYLGAGSVIDVSGERIDNSITLDNHAIKPGITDNGDQDDRVRVVTINDDNSNDVDDEIILVEGSHIDVSGGYVINTDHTLTGEDAGSIRLKADRVQTSGSMTGLALEGYGGGALSIHTDTITVSTSNPQALPAGFSFEDPLPEDMQGHLIVTDTSFTEGGFTHLALTSSGDLIVENGVNLRPSPVRLDHPRFSLTGYDVDNLALTTALPEEFGASSLSLKAGQVISSEKAEGWAIVETGTQLSVASEGNISVQGYSAYLLGSITAPGGDITLAATNGALVLGTAAMVDASGTTLPDWDSYTEFLGLNQNVINGGNVTLRGSTVSLYAGSMVDVSGSEAVTNQFSTIEGEIVTTILASAAGSVSVNYSNSFSYDGQIHGHSLFSWLPGGSFTLSKGKTDKPSNNQLLVPEEYMTEWVKNGFSAITLSSDREIEFLESSLDDDDTINLAVPSRLALNCSGIIGLDAQIIRLNAPWIQFTNIVANPDSDYFVAGSDSDDSKQRTFADLFAGTAYLNLAADFIDIKGNVTLSGFDQTTLRANNELRLYDYHYTTPQTGWSGSLRTMGDLTIEAGIIYPAMHHRVIDENGSQDAANTHGVYPTAFTISLDAKDEKGSIQPGGGGTLTILGTTGNTNENIYSAGGSLTLQAGDIEVQGVLAAPMGKIELKAKNGLHLSTGSVLTTRGESKVLYGMLENEIWTVGGHLNNSLKPDLLVTAAPATSVTIAGNEIIQDENSVIDIGGGGSIFAYQFLPGYEGSNNPLRGDNRYVILSDNSVTLPGKTVYLEGTDELPAGTYSLLPVEYAFLPGALIIEATNEALLQGETLTNSFGYTVIAGYESDRSITSASPLRSGYIIRSASDVLNEGKFDRDNTYTAGDAGSISISAGSGTSMLSGTIVADALDGYRGGSLAISAANLYVGTLDIVNEYTLKLLSLIYGVDINLVYDVDTLLGMGFSKLTLGGDTTKTLTLGAGSAVQGIPEVTLRASDRITLEQGVEVAALASEDQAGGSLTVKVTNDEGTGILVGETASLLQASDSLTLEIDNFNNTIEDHAGKITDNTFLGSILLDHGTFAFTSPNLYLETDGYAGSRQSSGAYLPYALQQTFAGLDAVTLQGTKSVFFLGTTDLTTQGDFTLESAHITVAAEASPAKINISAGGTLVVANNTDFTGNDEASGNTMQVSAAKNIIFAGDAQVFFDTFSDILFASEGETIFKGTGGLRTDQAGGEKLAFTASRFIAKETITENSDPLSLSLSKYTLDAGSGEVSLSGNGLDAGTIMAMPGTLTVKGGTITLQDADFDMPGGTLTFQATGNITANNSTLLAQGKELNVPIIIGDTVYDNSLALAGGQITFASSSGSVALDADTLLNATDATGKGGGTINLAAAQGGIALEGQIFGDKLYIDTLSLSDSTKTSIDMPTLVEKITEGGFSQLVDLRVRSGDVIIGQDDFIATEQFILTADQGAVDINGTIDASGTDGGTVEIWAKKAITLSGEILAKATDEEGEGGEVLLASSTAGVVTTGGSLIDVSGGNDEIFGAVSFRASRDAIKANAMDLDGDIQGDEQAIVRAFKVYTDTTINQDDIVKLNSKKDTVTAGYLKDIYDVWPSLTTAMTRWQWKDVELVPEIEVNNSNSNITIKASTDSTRPSFDDLNSLLTYIDPKTGKAYLPAITTGIFTLRTAKNLTLESDIVSYSKKSESLKYGSLYIDPIVDGIRDSWDINLIAGAELSSPRLMDVNEGTGTLTIAKSKLVYSESGDINFAAGKDVTIEQSSSHDFMPGTSYYSLASYDGNIVGYVGNNLTLNGGIIQTAVSDIALTIKNDVTMKESSTSVYGSIRTTGKALQAEEIPLFATFYELFPNAAKYPSSWCYPNEDGTFSYYIDEDGIDSDNDGKDADSHQIVVYQEELRYYANDMTWNYKDGGDISLNAGGNITTSLSQPVGFDSDMAYTDDVTVRVEQIISTYNKIDDLSKKTAQLTDEEKVLLANLTTYYNDLTDDGKTDIDLLASYGTSYVNSYLLTTHSAYYEGGGTNANLGIATMAGGNIQITGKAINILTGAFRQGNIDIYAQKAIDGKFLITNGDIQLTALENFGNISNKNTVIELGSGNVSIQSIGSVSLGTINNIILSSYKNVWDNIYEPNDGQDNMEIYPWDLSYSIDSEVNIHSILGDFVFSGDDGYVTTKQNSLFISRLLPGTLSITAAQDIHFESSDKLYLSPSADGQLELIAGNDIDGKVGDNSYSNTQIIISEVDPAAIYGALYFQKNQLKANAYVESDMLQYGTTSTTPLHIDDNIPILLTAGGDIAHLSLKAPKQASIKAEGDIREINYWGQNLHENDVSLISAGGDIVQQPYFGQNGSSLGIYQVGQGSLLIQAGGAIDLGSSEGIVSTGNSMTYDVKYDKLGNTINKTLYEEIDKNEYDKYKGADIFIISGYSLEDTTVDSLDGITNIIDKYYAIDSNLFDSQSTEIYINYDGYIQHLVQYRSQLLDNSIDLLVNKINSTDNSNRDYSSSDYLTDIESFITEIELGKSGISQESIENIKQNYAKILQLQEYSANLNAENMPNTEEGISTAQGITSTLDQFFSLLKLYSKDFSTLMATGELEDQNEAARLKEDMLTAIINPLLGNTQSGSGDIKMTQSVIKTTSGQDDLSIVAAGKVDVGTTVISNNESTTLGLLTEGGGGINVFADGDININESRSVTFFGGDIFMLSNHGDINAGRGSTTAVSAVSGGFDEAGGKIVPKFQAPAPGSGIRTLTADPDGAGPIQEPHQGKATLIAWEGVIDAGEAGISASDVILAATEILNSENISFSDAGVGVPTTTDAGPSLGALAGSTTVSDTQSATQSIGQQMTDGGKKLAESVSKMAEDLSIKMLVFKFEGFGGDSGSTME